MSEIFSNALIWVLLCLVPSAAAFYAVYFLMSLPLRRQERARFFLDLIEIGLQQGRTIEQNIAAAAGVHDRVLGFRFHLVANYIKDGLDAGSALQAVPRFLPTEILAMLKAGIKAGQLPAALLACRQRLKEGISQTWKAQNYLALWALFVPPVWIAVFATLCVFVFPKFMAIAADMEVETFGLLPWLTQNRSLLLGIQAVIELFFYLAALLYIGGPRLTAWIDRLLPGIISRLNFSLPWQRKKMQRDFSAMLSLLLDARVPEAQAVALAAQATANRVFQSHAQASVRELEQGRALPQALQHLDSSGEFQWRLTNAARGKGGFIAALAGWHDALAARAFRQEQTVAQLLTTALVLINGLMVGALAVAVFQLLISVDETGVLW